MGVFGQQEPFYDIVWLFQERAAGRRKSRAPAAVPDQKKEKGKIQGGCDPAGAGGERGPWLPKKQTKSNEKTPDFLKQNLIKSFWYPRCTKTSIWRLCSWRWGWWGASRTCLYPPALRKNPPVPWARLLEHSRGTEGAVLGIPKSHPAPGGDVVAPLTGLYFSFKVLVK